MIRSWKLALAALAAVAALSSVFTRRDPLPGFPQLILWAWERPEDLRFLTSGHTGVAFLDRTIWLHRDTIATRPRLQPLHVSEGIPLIAVVRIESPGKTLPPHKLVVAELLQAIQLPGVRALQIDFDARQSERPWYRQLLHQTRTALPANIPLTITALASWCTTDTWIADLPIADASPMLFRMGAGEQIPRDDFDTALCRSSLGLSTDELPRRLPHGRRMFFFHPRSWTPQAYQGALSQARLWR